jgi:hypothetical protein
MYWKVKNLGWIRLRERKLNGRQLKAFQIRDKPILNKILKPHCIWDLVNLWTFANYMKINHENLFVMIWQLSPPTFFFGHIYKWWTFVGNH